MLENKLGITSQVKLAKEEEKIAKIKAIELFDTNKINEYVSAISSSGKVKQKSHYFGLNLTVNSGIIQTKGVDNMTNIVPISDLKNYTEVLSHCDNGSTVYLTKNGRGKYVVQSLAEHEKLQATVKLLAELAKGVESIRTEGLLTIDEAFAGLDEEKQDPKEG